MVRFNVHLDMTIVVDWDVKLQTKQTNLKVFEILEHLPYSKACLKQPFKKKTQS